MSQEGADRAKACVCESWTQDKLNKNDEVVLILEERQYLLVQQESTILICRKLSEMKLQTVAIGWEGWRMRGIGRGEEEEGRRRETRGS